jgi:predicted ATPase
LLQAVQDSGSERLNELILVDTRTGTRVSHRDVGIGISQVLPVLVGAYGSQDAIVAMEQPEIHLHPALQAELGDVFIRSALGGPGNTFILETHSEHLILRIMRRMRETANGELPKDVSPPIPPTRPEDVAILYVQTRADTGSTVVRRLELDEEGKLLDPWPGGFFEEGFRERFSD